MRILQHSTVNGKTVFTTKIVAGQAASNDFFDSLLGANSKSVVDLRIRILHKKPIGDVQQALRDILAGEDNWVFTPGKTNARRNRTWRYAGVGTVFIRDLRTGADWVITHDPEPDPPAEPDEETEPIEETENQEPDGEV
jgi:hypothetical protein